MEDIINVLKELSLVSEKECNNYITNQLGLIKKDLDDIRDGTREKLNGDYLTKPKDNYL